MIRCLHGDPLSPYLFFLCAMGLQGLLHKAEFDGAIRGVSICRNGPRVSHLFFADDSVLFCRAKESECQVILDLFSVYERGSGQKINKDKTTFSSVPTLTMMSKSEYNICWVFQISGNMRDIWGYPHL